MLRNWTELLPLFVVRHLAKLKCETVNQGGMLVKVPRPGVMIQTQIAHVPPRHMPAPASAPPELSLAKRYLKEQVAAEMANAHTAFNAPKRESLVGEPVVVSEEGAAFKVIMFPLKTTIKEAGLACAT